MVGMKVVKLVGKLVVLKVAMLEFLKDVKMVVPKVDPKVAMKDKNLVEMKVG